MQGTSGVSGRPGTDGKPGLPGRQGLTGLQGQRGEKGPAVSALCGWVVMMLIVLHWVMQIFPSREICRVILEVLEKMAHMANQAKEDHGETQDLQVPLVTQ